MKYLLLLAFMVPAVLAAWCWPWLMDFAVYSRHGQRWADCMYLAGVVLPMIVFCVLILGVEWFASRRPPRVGRAIMLNRGDHWALAVGGVIQKIARPASRSDRALADDLQLAPGEELIRIAVGRHGQTLQEKIAADRAAVSRRRPRPVVFRTTFDLVDFRALVRGAVVRSEDDAGNLFDVRLADIGYDAMREEIDVLPVFHAFEAPRGTHVHKHTQAAPQAGAGEADEGPAGHEESPRAGGE